MMRYGLPYFGEADPIDLTPDQAVLEWDFPPFTIDIDTLTITPDQVVLEWSFPAFIVGGVPLDLTPDQAILEWSFPDPTVGARVLVSWAQFEVPDAPVPPVTHHGPAGLFFYDPQGNLVEEDIGPLLKTFAYEIHRYTNKIGDWRVAIPVDQQILNTTPPAPLSTRLKRGWRCTIVHEGSKPPGPGDELLYKGCIINAEYEAFQDGIALMIEGVFGEVDLVGRSTRKNLTFDHSFGGSIINTLASAPSMVFDNNVTIPPFMWMRSLSVIYDRTSRYEALIDAADRLRANVRPGWNHDRLELTSRDNLPSRGITFTNLRALDPVATQSAGAAGFGIIGGAIGFREDGSHIANRIIPIGVDTVEIEELEPTGIIGGGGGGVSGSGSIPATGTGPDELTLQLALTPGPFFVQSDLNPDGSRRYYIQDNLSIARYGLIEMDLNRSDIKNNVDSTGTRQAAATALYLAAAGELIRRRASVTLISAAILNGADIWLLPGDRAKVEYSGVALTAYDQIVWKEIDAFSLIMERVDSGQSPGNRNVAFMLGIPEFREDLPPLAGEAQVMIDIPGSGAGASSPDGPPAVDCPPSPGGHWEYEYGEGYGPPQPLEANPPQGIWERTFVGAPNGCGAGEAGANASTATNCCPEGVSNSDNDTDIPHGKK